MFADIEPYIIKEIKTARLRIHISFDGWGNKHKKLSVVGIVVYFINLRGEAVTRLIGFPEHLSHGKTGLGT
jgi:hypothetical protein